MRYSVLFFVLVNGMITDSATTATKTPTAAPGPTATTTASTTTATTSSKAPTAAPVPTTMTTASTTTATTSSKAPTVAPGPTTITTTQATTSTKAPASAPGPTATTTASTTTATTSSKAPTAAPGPTATTTTSTTTATTSSKAPTAAPVPTTMTTASTTTATTSSTAPTVAPGPTTITTTQATTSTKAPTSAPGPTATTTASTTTATTSSKAPTAAPVPTTMTTASTTTATTSSTAPKVAPGPTTITTQATTSTKAPTSAPGPTTRTTASATTSRTMAATTTISLVTGTATKTDQPGSHSTTVTVLNESTTTEINTTYSRDTTIRLSESTTSIATSTKQPDTTTKYPGETKDLSSLRINIDLQISLSNATFNESLKDRSSDIYIAYERSIRTKLYETYKDITGFNHVVIDNFSNGSVVCNYTVVVYADSNITYIADRIADATETLNFTNSSLKIFDEHFKMYVDEKIVNASIQKVKGGDICNLIDRACETFENCSLNPPGKILCTHKCYYGEHVCHNGGSCFYDARKKSVECKCTKDNDYIYYGPSCIQQAEKFALHKNDIIGLAAGCGGGVVVILLVVIIFLLKKKTRQGKESDQKLDLSREVSIEDIRLHRLSESHSSNGFQNRFEPRAKPNPYETRLPETKFLHGRAHDIYKDSTGEETYIYPSPSYIHPISVSGHRDSTKSGQSMYDYIDTESRFEIQRPRIRLGQSSAF